MAIACLSPEHLERLLREVLAPGEQTEMLAHLDVCADCRQRLEALAGGTEDWFKKIAQGPAPDSSRLAQVTEHCQAAETLRLASSAMDQAVLPGAKLRYFGDYEILEELGRGGMGVVYKARQVSLNRGVALKLILAGQLAGESELQRFRTEAEAAARLDHPHIVPIYEIGDHEGRHYFSMKLVEGGSLAEGVARSASEIARLVATIARAVHYAHQRGVLHRDLKPSNILLDAQRQPYLTDFGLAKLLGSDAGLTRSGAVMGTPNYLAPEVAAGKTKEVTTSADIFSLGAILYELLTGRPPFADETVAATLQKVLSVEPPLPRSLNPAVPHDLETICLQCLEKEPIQRCRSAELLADELDRFVRGEPILARPSTSLERIIKWMRRKPALAGSLAALVLVFVLGFAGVLWTWRGEVRQRHLAQEEGQRAFMENQRALEAVTRLEFERAKANALNVAAARSDCSAAEARLRAGDGPAAFAHLARACEFDPSSTLAGEKVIAVLNEWRYRLPVLILQGHKARVMSARFSPNGSRIVTASIDQTARVWDAATGKTIAVAGVATTDLGNFAERMMHSAQFSPDGSRIVTAILGQPARVWDAATGKAIVTGLGYGRNVRNAQFNPDGSRIVTASIDQTARVWDAATGQSIITLTGHKGIVKAAQFSPDGSRVVTTSEDKTVRVWDVATGQAITTLTGHEGIVKAAQFSPDGSRIVTASEDKTARVWDAATGQPITTLSGHEGKVEAAQFSPDGSRVVTASEDKTARVWDAANGKVIVVLSGHNGGVWDAQFSPDGLRIVTGSWDASARVWDALTGVAIAILSGHGDRLETAQFSPDGSRIVTASMDKTTRVWDATPAATAETIATLSGHKVNVLQAQFSPKISRIGRALLGGGERVWDVTGNDIVILSRLESVVETLVTSMEFSPDGSRIVTDGVGDKTARVRDAATRKTIVTLSGHGGAVRSAQFSPNGSRIVTASEDKTARVWDATTGKATVTLIGHGDEVRNAQFSPDDSRIVTCSKDKSARVWDAATGQTVAVLSGHSDWIKTAQFSPDGSRIVTASEDKTARVWDAATGKVIVTLSGHEDGLRNAQFSPDGLRVVTASVDKTARVWDANNGNVIVTLSGHKSVVTEAQFSPDGLRIVTASLDKTAQIWDAATGKAIATLAGHRNGIITAQFSPDGSRIVTASIDTTARVWTVLPPSAGPPPEWFAGLLRYVAQLRLNPDGELETLKPEDWFALRDRMQAVRRASAGHKTPYLDVLRRFVTE